MFTHEIQLKINKWLSEPYDKSTRDEVYQLVQFNKNEELYDRFYKNLEFGTGGFRGILGAGTNRMNKYTISMIAQGFSNYLLKKNKSVEKGIVIGYDSRKMSKQFAFKMAYIFMANDIKVYLFREIKATPIISFAVFYLKTIAGIILTASHNPKEYHGVKILSEYGGQVLFPIDSEIMKEILDIESINCIKGLIENNVNKNLLHYIDSNLEENYYKKALSIRLNFNNFEFKKICLKISFTPLHGTGNIPIRELLKRAGFSNLNIVAEQEMPNGLFPTVESPNPEDPKALELVISLAKKTQSDLVLATDPDADRLGVAVLHNGNFILLNGNQIGIILIYYFLSQLKDSNFLPKNAVIFKTIVSSDLAFLICKDFGVQLIEVLTGFKYISEQIHIWTDIIKGEKKYLGSFEESYGYNFLECVREKDAISTALLISDISNFCKINNKTLIDYLDSIYQRYNYFEESLYTLTLNNYTGSQQIKNIMNYFRITPPKKIANTKIIQIKDLYKNKDNLNKKKKKFLLPKSNVLIFYLEDNSKIIIRPSGTEKKIKFYFLCCEYDNEYTSLNKSKIKIKKKINILKDDLIKNLLKKKYN